MTKSGVEYLAAHPGWKTKTNKPLAEPLDESDVATILAALRLFQQTYRDMGSEAIADNWPLHFTATVSDYPDPEITVDPMPLGFEDINRLCERINCSRLMKIERRKTTKERRKTSKKA
jgi:hypothetical protein